MGPALTTGMGPKALRHPLPTPTLISDQAWLQPPTEMQAHPSTSLHQGSQLSLESTATSHTTQRTVNSHMLYWGLASECQPDGQARVSPELGSSSNPLALHPEQPFWDLCPHERLKAPRVKHPASLQHLAIHTGILSHQAFKIPCHCSLKAPPFYPSEGVPGQEMETWSVRD